MEFKIGRCTVLGVAGPEHGIWLASGSAWGTLYDIATSFGPIKQSDGQHSSLGRMENAACTACEIAKSEA